MLTVVITSEVENKSNSENGRDYSQRKNKKTMSTLLFFLVFLQYQDGKNLFYFVLKM